MRRSIGRARSSEVLGVSFCAVSHAASDDASSLVARYGGHMTRSMRIILESGKAPRRIVAGAMDWPGLDRWGRTEPAAVDALRGYLDRYAPVAHHVMDHAWELEDRDPTP